MTKMLIVWMILAAGCYVRFQCQHFTLFSSTYATLQTDTDKQTSLKKCNSGLGFDRVGATYFLTLCEIATLVWVATHTIGTTGLNA